MSILDELVPGKRENAFYVKSNVLQSEDFSNEDTERPKKVCVYEWDENEQKRVGRLVDASQYYRKFD